MINRSIENICVIMCAPLSKYPEQPSDQSKCELIDCPDCNNHMWLSEKKKQLMKKFIPENIMLKCYDCLKEFALKNPDFIKDHIKIDI